MDLTKAPVMPQAPGGHAWRVTINGDCLQVALQDAYGETIAFESREMVIGIRNYWDTQGVVVAIRMADEILRRLEYADILSAQLGVRVRVDQMSLRQVGEKVWLDTDRVFAVIPSDRINDGSQSRIYVAACDDTYTSFYSYWNTDQVAEAIRRQDG